jgi:hypothetical protein
MSSMLANQAALADLSNKFEGRIPGEKLKDIFQMSFNPSPIPSI